MEFAVFIGPSEPFELRTLLQRAVDTGFKSVQLSPRFVADEEDWQKISEELTRLDLRLIAMGGYANPLQPKDAASSVAKLQNTIKNAAFLGCKLVVTWSGTRGVTLFDDDPGNKSAETWSATVAHFREVAKWAEEADTTVAVEPFHNHVARSPERLRDLLDEVDSPRIGAVMDPPNFLKAGEIEDVNSRLESMFQTLANRIVLVHAKDLRRPHPGEQKRVIDQVALPHPGDGILDYRLYGRLTRQYYRGPVVIEHITDDTMAIALAYVTEHMGVAGD